MCLLILSADSTQGLQDRAAAQAHDESPKVNVHQLLEPKNLSSLPPAFQRLALSAAEGSWNDLKGLLQLLNTTGDSETWVSCLPVFYANLDTAGIPKDHDDIGSDPVRCAILALSILCHMKGAYATAGSYMWPRMWAWCDFLHTNRALIGAHHRTDDVSADLLLFVACLRQDSKTATMMGQTPGVRGVLMDGWAALSDMSAGDSDGFAYLSTLLRDFMDADLSENFEEILDAADGPIGLALLVVKYIKHFMPAGRIALTEKVLFLYDGILTFTTQILDGPGGLTRLDIATALLDAGIVQPLTAVLCAMSESTLILQEVGPLLDCFEVLKHIFMVPGAHKAIADAIGAGLLHGIAHSIVVCEGSEGLETSALWKLVTIDLPATTVYRSVLVQMEPRLLELDEFTKSRASQRTAVCHDWLTFVGLARERITVMNDRTEDCLPSRKACDNMECGLIREKTEFKRCAHCRGVYYCSSDCQKRDWRSGHRDTCNSLRISRFRVSDISAQDVSFLRKLFHKDSHLLETPEKLRARLDLMRCHPDEPTVSVLDYRNSSCSSYITTLALARTTDRRREICWDEHIARAARSGGRMELHVMHIFEAGRMRQFMFPKRSAGSALHDGLTRILNQGLDPHKEATILRDAIKGLLRIH
ncbi:hypothetical protein DFH06DRAFT_1230358 [Mycena polygramma]|nr:hypothetical protein DFH06DRAFT_1230358 [Mycena polygramma]